MKIAVGMSGGIDSSATLIRLYEEGHSLIGITMKVTASNQEYEKCCSIKDIDDAKGICQKLGISHYTIDLKKEFHDKVISYFIKDYMNGKTPNPCIFCNPLIKFKYLIESANSLGYEKIATGHYAIVEKHLEQIILKCSVDKKKDQSYFLSRLSLKVLEQSLFPLGKTIKSQNIQLLKDRGIDIYKKKESHEICFVPGDDYTKFLKKETNNQIKPGPITNEEGQIIGEHQGVPLYTIGQRRGLNIALGKPVYVRNLNAKSNTIVIGDKLLKDHCYIDNINWLTNYDFKKPLLLNIKVRYLHKGEYGILIEENKKIAIKFKKPVLSITKGQSAVGYLDEKVIFSGVIL